MDNQRALVAAMVAAEKLVRAESVSVIRSAVGKVVNRFRQNLQGQTIHQVRHLLSNLSTKLRAELIERSNLWAGSQKLPSEPVLPDHCRFFKQTGINSLVVLEYKPQLRTLLFSDGMVNSKAPVSITERSGSNHVLLSLPYVIFTVPFFKGTCGGVYANFRNLPLHDLNDMLFFSNLPNIQLTQTFSRVCFGQTQWATGTYLTAISALPLSKQVDLLVGAFWQTVFNGDYGERYQACAERNNDLYISNWREKSKKDPSFITKIKWDPMCSLKDLIDALIPKELDILGPNLVSEVDSTVKNFLAELDSLAQQAFLNVEIKDKDVETAVKEELATIVAKCCKEALTPNPPPAPLPGKESAIDVEMLLIEMKRLREKYSKGTVW